MITRKGYMRYQIIIQEKEITKIIENGELQESYIWVDEAGNTIKLVVKIKTKNPRKDIPKIRQKRKKS